MKALSVIIAVYNEKNTILKVLERIRKVDVGMEKELVIIDGCSTDGTRQLLAGLNDPQVKVILEDKKNGKGFALRRGFAEARGEIILIQDADLEIDPFDYPRLLAPIISGEAAVVYCSRFLNGRGKANLISYIGNKLVTLAANMLYGGRLSDIETCYKVFRPQVIRGLEFQCNGFDFDAEFTVRILKKGCRIIEVPVVYNPRTRKDGKKLHWTVFLPSLWAIVKAKFQG